MIGYPRNRSLDAAFDAIIKVLAPINQSKIPEKKVKGRIPSDNPHIEIW
jgi:hypothetical protein